MFNSMYSIYREPQATQNRISNKLVIYVLLIELCFEFCINYFWHDSIIKAFSSDINERIYTNVDINQKILKSHAAFI
ncbi:hypothetical protein BpHYR1_023051 [Brachionus plicatilis]|uniref:Uncharacterized protein n=1 Tax=Brachionus plicatilis TaxID=10195 RepID=A0A3M7P896_BRAPC|nr:hypothetical protein BpHYR1_023051 [Brachionus plicatilis]